MRKFISLLICLVLLVGIVTIACACDINNIQPSTTTIIPGVTNQDIPINGTLPNYDTGSNTTIIIDSTPTLVPTQIDNEEAQEIENISTEQIALQSEIYALINEERIERNLKVLEYNFDLQEAASIRAKEASKQFAHTRPDGTDFASVFDIKIEYEVAGENLLLIDKPVADAEVIVNTWMYSEGHMKNIIAERYFETAIGIYEKDGVIYIAQLFIG